MTGEPYDDLYRALAAMFQNRDGVRITSRLRAEIERDPMYRAWQVMREAAARDWDRWLGAGEIPPAFRRPEPEPADPHAEALALNEGARLAREAAQTTATDLRGPASIAVCLMPEPTPPPRPHAKGLDCWCKPFDVGTQVIHIDWNMPSSWGGYIIQHTVFAEEDRPS